ncbi:acetyl esterase/lipase [Rhodococcus sp. SMB37]|uniref:alpha/beta hydrolase fold domain-containing protein n=1 Tax=Rhodococcus sp. SMB37 TaxID=2512213 RepID=UPI0006CF5F4B|nr:alpha/beta hydrolase fold domain-containing protein [Rhodococcus sp. SMB37]TCN56872.1 acetyl esterase/lipase [Rhodococcus sp. SMB37]
MTDTELSSKRERLDVEIEALDSAPVPILRVRPAGARPDAALLHFHGGGYRKGSPRMFADSVARIAAACETQVFSVGYRLSGECAFPGAMDDAVTAYRWLAGMIPGDHLALWGDSAGGGLAAALLLRLRQLEVPGPAGAFLFSPWADLRNTASSFRDNEHTDERFSLEQATEAAAAYLSGHPAVDPMVSPVLGDWAGQPRLIVQCSDSEVLRDDALLLARTAEDAGVDVRVKVHEGVPHIWNLSYPATTASELAISYMAEQLDELFGSNLRR